MLELEQTECFYWTERGAAAAAGAALPLSPTVSLSLSLRAELPPTTDWPAS